MMKPAAWSRRKFLHTVTGAGAVMALSPFAARAADGIDPRVAKIVAGSIGIDTHNHIDVPLTTGATAPDIDLAGEMKKSGLSAICMTFALDYQKLDKEGEAWERFQNGLTAMDKQLERNKMKRALTMQDLQTAHDKGQPTVIQSIEGGHFLEGHLDRLGEAYKRGLRHFTLLHDSDASVPLGDVYTNEPKFGGLTAFGTEVVKECNRLGIVVDLTHCSKDAVVAAIKLSKHPVMTSHTGLDTQLGQNENMARMMRPRLISKETARLVADAGGIIGVWTHLADSTAEYAKNIKAMVDVVGVDHVCIGTDTKLTPAYRPAGFGGPDGPGGNPNDRHDGPPPGGGNAPGGNPNDKHDGPPPGGNGQNGPGGGGQNRRFGERTNEAWEDQKAGFYYAVADALLKLGLTPEDIGKIGGGNFCRVFGAVTKG